MIIYKFGGASVSDETGIKNLGKLVSLTSNELVVVVSALGKTTNALENVVNKWFEKDGDHIKALNELSDYHNNIIDKLFIDDTEVKDYFNTSVASLKEYLNSLKCSDYDQVYDQVVSLGEIWSTKIVEKWLRVSGISSCWLDIRKTLITDDRFRDANIQWSESISRLSVAIDFKLADVFVVQGFIGGTASGQSTTLGREGSDFTAAIMGNILDAERVEIWKDVPGVLNADPKWMPNAERLGKINYKEAVEMSFSGAKVIHPKTIKPLFDKRIPLYVRSFINPESEGTIISEEGDTEDSIPVFIRKEKQILISILPRDLSFIIGDNLSRIFHAFYTNGVTANLIQASAISIAVCVNNEERNIQSLIRELEKDYKVIYNKDVEMLTIRHYNDKSVQKIASGREILVEQKTRRTIRIVVKSDID